MVMRSPVCLAIVLAQGTDTVTRIGAFRAANGEQYWTGTGSQVSWRTRAPFLAVAGSAGTFAGENRVYAVDPNDGVIRDLEPLGAKFYGSIAWHPSADRVLYTAADDPFAERDVYTRALSDDAPKRVESPKKIWDAWWSSDGSKIYATAARGTTAGAPGVGDFAPPHHRALCPCRRPRAAARPGAAPPRTLCRRAQPGGRVERRPGAAQAGRCRDGGIREP